MINYPSLTQSKSWQQTNILLGNKAEFLGDNCLYIIKNSKRGRFMEIPGGPILDWKDKKEVESFLKSIKSIAKKNHCVFVRIRPEIPNSKENLELFSSLGLVPSPMHLAAENTVFLDLDKPIDTLLMNLRRQTRYEIRRADKLKIRVINGNSDAIFDEFSKIQIETAHRQNFVPPKKSTLMAEKAAFKENAKIYVAETETGEKIAYGLILKAPELGISAYFEAASTELNRHLPGAYALLWQAIKDLKSEGIRYFNLWGIAPNDEKTKKPRKNHRYSGVTTFKTGFGGEIVNFLPAHDLIIDKVRYPFSFFVEYLRKKHRNL